MLIYGIPSQHSYHIKRIKITEITFFLNCHAQIKKHKTILNSVIKTPGRKTQSVRLLQSVLPVHFKEVDVNLRNQTSKTIPFLTIYSRVTPISVQQPHLRLCHTWFCCMQNVVWSRVVQFPGKTRTGEGSVQEMAFSFQRQLKIL